MHTTPTSKNMLPQEAKLMAQFIAMAPFVFQTALSLRDFGILKKLLDQPEGVSFQDLLQDCKLSQYSLSVLLDAGESAGIVLEKEGQYTATAVGAFLETDAITRVNMNFTQDVCYEGLFHLKEALETNTPAGLKVFGKWKTIYEGLSRLPKKVQQSWFEFDHFFSDDCFPRALPVVFQQQPKKILDVGGNTGKFAVAATRYDAKVQVTIADHPGQIEMAQKNALENGVADRVHFFPINLLEQTPLPEGHDVIWMSQLLSCFSEDEVVLLLKKARQALAPGGSLLIMETFTDTQKYNTARFCLDMTSLYFTVMANGNSRMYRGKEFAKLVQAAELRVVEEHPYVRLNHTILRCQPC